jgi:hypothetical protein
MMIKFKHKEDEMMFTMLHPALIMIFADLAYYAQSKHNIDLVVTETITTEDEDKKLRRRSKSHQQGRAIDIRTRDIDPFIVQDLINYVNNKREYLRFHYMSKTGIKRLAFFHVGNAEHIHLALHSQFSVY